MDVTPRQVVTVTGWLIVALATTAMLAVAHLAGLIPCIPALYATTVAVKQLRLEFTLRREMREWLTTGK